MRLKKYFVIILLVFLPYSLIPDRESLAIKKSYRKRSTWRKTPRIIDYRRHLSRRYRKIRRRYTKFIIVHTSEAGLKSTLRTVCKGKVRHGRRYTRGGHANYVISRNGTIYLILDHRYMADHAGRSMWNGLRNISRYSVGIELVGYHYGQITSSQYRALRYLLKKLMRYYHIPQRNILTHAQVAYGLPNRWIRYPHRGRKKCALNFNRRLAGLGPGWSYDPDVRAGRLRPDPYLAGIFYKKRRVATIRPSNIITSHTTAWSIAGEDYDSPNTLYILPSGRLVRGDRVASTIGWDHLPKGTRVLLNQPEDISLFKSEVKILRGGVTAWSIAGKKYKSRWTKYFLPNKKILSGRQIRDWDQLPLGTKMIVGYRGPYYFRTYRELLRLTRGMPRSPRILYLFPSFKIKKGSQIKNPKRLPKGTCIFLKLRS